MTCNKVQLKPQPEHPSQVHKQTLSNNEDLEVRICYKMSIKLNTRRHTQKKTIIDGI